jgi:DNA (cytosine-5)-methyltransferase 1
MALGAPIGTGTGERPTAIELFAGVGGFRLALEATGWSVVWSNQWEPGSAKQHASDCYKHRFGGAGHVCMDIARVLDVAQGNPWVIPDHDLVVGGFPCQDYSVAKTLNQARGIEGKKGVLWWDIHRLLSIKRPSFLFLENVDRLLKSPATQRGRDFAIMLASLSDLGYEVEWRVVNAAEYGFPQKRRRVFIIGRLAAQVGERAPTDAAAWAWMERDGVLARALPVTPGPSSLAVAPDFTINGSLVEVTNDFGTGRGATPFRSSGVMSRRRIWTRDLRSDFDGPFTTLGDMLEPESEVPDEYWVTDRQLAQWEYLKGAKREQRTHRESGTPYFYTEGGIPFPDSTDGPSRTILTGEGGTTPSRFKHIIQTSDGRYRRLTPRELERLDGFPDDWTDTGMPDGRRAFCMGNALVVGLVRQVTAELIQEMPIRRSALAESKTEAVASAS